VEARDGTRLAVVEAGVGEPVLCIPGLGYASWSFAHQVTGLSTVARVLAMDNRGTGLSDKPPGPYSIGQLAEDAHAVLTQRGAAPATVVGTSMGGYVALTLALRYPHTVSSLVLTATTCGGPGSSGVPEETLRSWAKAAPLGAEGFARATMPLSFAPGWCEERQDEYEELLALRLGSPTPVEAWRAQFQACAEFLQDGLPEGALSQPTVIVHGTADRVVPYENAAHLAKRLPHASIVTLQGAGHLCWIEQPRAFNDIVLKSMGASA
jgi:pimeloyl-ACP methyl ester carboxylesterase